MKQKRWVVLDLLKAIIVAFMIIGHTLIWWYSENDASVEVTSSFMEKSMSILFPFIAFLVMCIPITAGIALRFFWKRHWDPQKQKIKQIGWAFFKILGSRTLIFLFLGYVLNILAWEKEDWLAWDVLQFYAVSFFSVSLFLYFFSVRWLLGLGVLVLLGTPILRDWFFDERSYLKVILVSDQSGDHFWPVFPWMSIVIAGFLVGHLYLRFSRNFSKVLFLVGSLFLYLSFLWSNPIYQLDFQNVWGVNFFQPSIGVVLAQIGFCFLFLLVLHLFYKNHEFSSWSVVNSFSYGIAPIYFFNIVVGSKITNWFESTGNILMLSFSIILQLMISYLIGVVVIFCKTRKN